VAEQAEADIKTITLVPEYQGLTAGTYTIVRRDLLNASHFEGSPEEILQSTTVAPAGRADQPLRTELPGKAWTLFTGQRIDASPYEYGHFLLSREKLLFGGRYEWMNGLMLGGTIALESGSDVPPIAQTERKQVRSRLYDYTQQLGGIEQLYVNAMHSFGGGWHGRVTGGLLEEMYRGVSTEVLYQRLDARWAVGAEANWLQQRDPESEFGKTDYDTLTGNISFYYEVPPRDLTVIVRAEQFLARDQGVTLELQQQFQQGIRLGFVGTYSNRRDYGGPEDRGHSDARMVLSVPLQYSVQDVVINNGTQVRMGAIARDAGQSVEMPVRLWDATRPVSYGPLLRSWEDVLNW
jgi:hypothetical protein